MTKRRTYSTEDDNIIKTRYPWQDIKIIATELNRTETAIVSRALKLGVRRVPQAFSKRVKLVHSL